MGTTNGITSELAYRKEDACYNQHTILFIDHLDPTETLVVMSLSQDRKKTLRSIGHKLNPVVTVAGNGLTENVLIEIDRALEDHELIKIKYAVGDRELKKKLLGETEKKTRSVLIQSIGNIGLFYRPAKEPDPKKSNLSY